LDLPLNGDILSFAILLCVAACVVSGIAPALSGARANLSDALKEGGRTGSGGRRSQHLGRALVASEVAMALIAIIAAGLFTKSFGVARHIDPGFDPANVLVAPLEMTATGYDVPQRREFCQRLRARLAAHPGVLAVSWAETTPLWFFGGPVEEVEPEGYVPGPSESMKVERNIVDPGYFNLMRIPLVEGRDFDEHDTANAAPVLIVNQTFARRYFPGREAVGRHVRTIGERYTIVGIARDCKYVKPTENARPFFYAPLRQAFRGETIIAHIRMAGEPEGAAPIARREVSAVGPSVRIFDILPMTECIRAGLIGESMAAALLTVLGVFALALATTGLYSLMAYAVAQRTQEIGIRMALGAQSADVLGLVVRQGMGLTLVGVAVGAAAALALMRLAASQLVHVSASDPLIFGGASLFLAAIALAANYLPARRALPIASPHVRDQPKSRLQAIFAIPGQLLRQKLLFMEQPEDIKRQQQCVRRQGDVGSQGQRHGEKHHHAPRIHGMAHQSVWATGDHSLPGFDLNYARSEAVYPDHPEDDQQPAHDEPVAQHRKPRRHARPPQAVVQSGQKQNHEKCRLKPLNHASLLAELLFTPHSSFQQLPIMSIKVDEHRQDEGEDDR